MGALPVFEAEIACGDLCKGVYQGFVFLLTPIQRILHNVQVSRAGTCPAWKTDDEFFQ